MPLRFLSPSFLFLAWAVTPAAAQTEREDKGEDMLMAGLGLGIVPAYEGADQSRAVPVPGLVGRVDGIKFVLLGNQASVDLLRDRSGPGWDLQLGPIASLGFNRAMPGAIDDPRVRALGKVALAVEVGGYVGIARQGVVTSDYDRLSLTLGVRRDVAGAHEGTLLVPTITYLTPLSRKALVSLFATATHADGNYADTYYTITPGQSAASGLPTFKAGAGWTSWTAGAAGLLSLIGDMEHGLMLAGGVGYGRMLGDFAASPVVSIAGSRNQWSAGIGLAYSF